MVKKLKKHEQMAQEKSSVDKVGERVKNGVLLGSRSLSQRTSWASVKGWWNDSFAIKWMTEDRISAEESQCESQKGRSMFMNTGGRILFLL